MKKYMPILFLLTILGFQQASAKVTVVASLTDLASIASSVGGDHVESMSIARANADPHSVEILPSYMVRVSRADIYLKVGLGLDQWADGIIDGSRNAKLRIVDCSQGISLLEKPTTKVTALQGDVHSEGNPHYWLDPRNGLTIAQAVHDALVQADPSNRAAYDTNLEVFTSEVNGKMAEWTNLAESLPAKTIITYHSSWPYFANTFGFEIASRVEPVPGIPPTASHLADLVEIIHSRKIVAVIQEPYFPDDAANYLARETGVRIAKVSPSCGDASSNSYLAHFQTLFTALQEIQE